jgi:hypothetical protein
MRTLDTLIIGGGIAGLACARRLSQAGRDFRLITDRLGGRMFAGETPMRNFGAMYVTDDYRHVRQFVDRGVRLRRRDVFYRHGDELLPLLHPRVLRQGRALTRIFAELVELRRQLNRLRAACPMVCQADLLRRDPFLERLTSEPAAEFVKRNGLADFGGVYVDPVVNATVFAATGQVNTFYYLAALTPVLVPTYLGDFSRTLDRLTAGYREKVLLDRVLAVATSSRGDFQVTTAELDLRARNIVVATPAHNLREFFPEIDRSGEDGLMEIPMVTLHVRGRRRPEYRLGKIVYLGPGEVATVLLAISPGLDVLFTRAPDPDLSPYYEQCEIIARVRWKTAVQLSRAAWRPLAPRPGLFTIGDYNLCGLEDSYLTGLYAANRIIA